MDLGSAIVVNEIVQPLLIPGYRESFKYGTNLCDLGSVIIDCEDKHYNTVVCGIPQWLMVLWIRRTAPRSIVTDHYLLDHYADALISVYVTNERVGWSC